LPFLPSSKLEFDGTNFEIIFNIFSNLAILAISATHQNYSQILLAKMVITPHISYITHPTLEEMMTLELFRRSLTDFLLL
jgi:hypothetical protein